MVLYVDDIAKVLRKSKKAISELIARKDLPFEIKVVGRCRCIDIFQIAQWLASDARMAQQVVAPPVNVPASVKVAKAAKKVGNNRAAQHQVPDGALMSSMAGEILKMRHDYSDFMGRLFCYGVGRDELLLLQELSERLFFSSDQLNSSYVASFRKLAPKGHKVRGQETNRYFEEQEPAILYLMAKVYGVEARGNKVSWQFILKHCDETLIHLVKNGDQWVQLENSVGVEFGALW